jgi:aspartyl-tRNA(Asn)/glutamyl-tRNA(Gln) amidotransferase subunit C
VTAVATLARAEVDELATLARLALTEAEAERLRDELGAILAHVAALAEVDVDGVAPMTHAVPMDLAPARRPGDRVAAGGRRARRHHVGARRSVRGAGGHPRDRS